MKKDADAFRTIGEVADALEVPQHVLRFWEERFPQIDPLKRGGGRRYYRPDQVALIAAIRQLLYRDGYTIKGVQRMLNAKGAKAVAASVRTGQTQVDGGKPISEESGSAPSSNGCGPDLPVPSTDGGLQALLADIDDCLRLLADARRSIPNG